MYVCDSSNGCPGPGVVDVSNAKADPWILCIDNPANPDCVGAGPLCIDEPAHPKCVGADWEP